MAQDIRLYITEPLTIGRHITLADNQAHYLVNVMRVSVGDHISLFNGQDGQWRAEVETIHKKHITLQPREQTRPQSASPDIWLAFAPIKNKSELVVEKATELGATKLLPVVTRHAVVRSVNIEKLTAHAIEASEQCERLDVPTLETHKDLSYLLGNWPKDRLLLYGDESGDGAPLPSLLKELPVQKLALLIGPEGGFASEEFEMLRTCDFAKGFGMGPRILRADTAAVAALSCIMAARGDWSQPPHFIAS